ncbi:hypothetical protein PMAYCL1PPCAC_19955 [Pristionchus mayeri]|uniref:Ubiquitin-like domain-containing protein n=1 Tax=Pristionchus mayeri TaxID=1317129 RepID=A0AAN5CSI2_9BILA|nr:hypothetical protein PMAYCL1PPCAC_19955 [Pristionchus mayeri]
MESDEKKELRNKIDHLNRGSHCKSFEIYIRTLESEPYPLVLCPCKLVIDVKRAIEKCKGISTDVQRLIFAGNELEDDKTLEYFNIHKESILFLVILRRLSPID